MSSSRTGPPLRVAPSGLFSWLPLWSSPLLLFSLQVPLFLPAHRVTTSRSACLELRGHDSMFPPSRCAIRGHLKICQLCGIADHSELLEIYLSQFPAFDSHLFQRCSLHLLPSRIDGSTNFQLGFCGCCRAKKQVHRLGITM